MSHCPWKPLIAAALVAVPSLLGCGRPQAAPTFPAPKVTVVTVEAQKLVLSSELPGRTSGYLVAEIRPQVNGLIQKRLFTEGTQVNAGQDLYQIDPAPYQAALDNAVANLSYAKSAAEKARATLAVTMAGRKRHESTLALAKTNLRGQQAAIPVHVCRDCRSGRLPLRSASERLLARRRPRNHHVLGVHADRCDTRANHRNRRPDRGTLQE